MLKKTSAVLAGIATLVLMGCGDSPVASEETSLTTDLSSSAGSSNLTAVEGVWLLTKEESEIDTIEFSYTDKSKYLTPYVLMLNNDNSAVIKTYGIQFVNGFYSAVNTYEKSKSTMYTTNGSYLILDGDALKFTNNGTVLTLESSGSKRYFTSYTGLLPLENWEYENIYEYGFEPLTESTFAGNWIYKDSYNNASMMDVDESGSFYDEEGYGYWEISNSGALTMTIMDYYEEMKTTYSDPVASLDGDLVILNDTTTATVQKVLYNYEEYLYGISDLN